MGSGEARQRRGRAARPRAQGLREAARGGARQRRGEGALRRLRAPRVHRQRGDPDGRARRRGADDRDGPAGRRGRGHPEVRARRAGPALPAALRRGRAAGRDGPDRAAGRLGPGRDPHPRERGERPLLPRRPEDLHHQRRRRRAPGAGARGRDLRADQGHHEGPVALHLPARAARRDEEPAHRRAARAQAGPARLADGGDPLRARRGVADRRPRRRLQGHARSHEQRAARRGRAGDRDRRGRRRGGRPLRGRAQAVRHADRRPAADEEPALAHDRGARGQPRPALPRVRADRPQRRACAPRSTATRRSARASARSSSR